MFKFLCYVIALVIEVSINSLYDMLDDTVYDAIIKKKVCDIYMEAQLN